MTLLKWLGASGSLACLLVAGCYSGDAGADEGQPSDQAAAVEGATPPRAPTTAAPGQQPAAAPNAQGPEAMPGPAGCGLAMPAPAMAPCGQIAIPEIQVPAIAPPQVSYRAIQGPPQLVPQLGCTTIQPPPIAVPQVQVTMTEVQPPAITVPQLSLTAVESPPIIVPEITPTFGCPNLAGGALGAPQAPAGQAPQPAR